jgi:hypothetical protein
MYGLISFVRSNENLTASASKSVPSWNFTPERSVNVYVSPSSDTSQLSARRPSNSAKSGAFHATSVSNTLRMISLPMGNARLVPGSKFAGSESTAITRVDRLKSSTGADPEVAGCWPTGWQPASTVARSMPSNKVCRRIRFVMRSIDGVSPHTTDPFNVPI